MALSWVAWNAPPGAEVLAAFGPPTHWTMEQSRAGWHPPTDGEAWSRTVVLLQGSRPAAVASAFHSELHPVRESCYIDVAPDHRRQGYGRAALAELRRQLPPQAGPFRSKVQAGSAGEQFARRHGFQLIQRTREVRVMVPDGSVLAGESSGLRTAEHPSDEMAAAAWRAFYIAGHDWDPPGAVSHRSWQGLLTAAGDDVVVAAWRGGTIVGIALVSSRESPVTFAGGALARDDPQAPAIATHLLVAGAELTADRCLDVELDDWMWEVAHALETWSPDVGDVVYIVAQSAARRSPVGN